MKTVGRWAWRKLERHEITWLGVGLTACVALFAFVSLAGEVMEGDTEALDSRLLLMLRDPADPAQLRGPAWFESALLDLTAMGGPVILGMVVLAVTGFLALQGRQRTALVVLVASMGGQLLNELLKFGFDRPRPSIVPHLRDVASTSFPSGHAMQSAIIYLTLGALLMRIAERRLTKVFCLGTAVFLTLIIGLSHVFLGVHYPTDVIGGWMFGFAWASACWLVEQRFERVTGVAEERKEAS